MTVPMPVPCDYVCAYACAGACACAWPVPVPMPLAMPVPLPVLVPVYVSVPVSMSVSVSSFCGKCSRVQQGLRAHRTLCATTCVDSACVQSKFRKPAAFLHSQLCAPALGRGLPPPATSHQRPDGVELHVGPPEARVVLKLLLEVAHRAVRIYWERDVHAVVRADPDVEALHIRSPTGARLRTYVVGAVSTCRIGSRIVGAAGTCPWAASVIPHPRSGANSRRAGACRQSCLSQWLRMVVMVMVKRVVLAVRLQKHTCAHFAHSHIIVHLMESNLCNTKSKDVCDIPSSHLTHTHTCTHTLHKLHTR